jgi:hypothetical protein
MGRRRALGARHRIEARDAFRHPMETLRFFGLQPAMTVVEFWPGSGWYTEILAPYLASGARATYVAAVFPEGPMADPAQAALNAAFQHPVLQRQETVWRAPVHGLRRGVRPGDAQRVRRTCACSCAPCTAGWRRASPKRPSPTPSPPCAPAAFWASNSTGWRLKRIRIRSRPTAMSRRPSCASWRPRPASSSSRRPRSTPIRKTPRTIRSASTPWRLRA